MSDSTGSAGALLPATLDKAEPMPSWYTEQALRSANPDLDEIQGHRAFLPPGHGYTCSQLDELVDRMAGTDSTDSRKRKRSLQIMLSRSSRKTLDYSRLMLVTNDWSPLFVARAVYAGFFPFASEVECAEDEQPLEERCLLNLELGGEYREPSGEHADMGGRIVLRRRPDGAFPLKVGKKTIKMLRVARGRGTAFTFRAGASMAVVLDRLRAAHGVDWIGFRRVRDLCTRLAAGSPELPVRAVSLELWAATTDDAGGHGGGGEERLASAELGLVVGSAYTCLSLFVDPAAPPRSDRLRALAAILHLESAGVTLVDVGTSANYFCDIGFVRTTRPEFVGAWREARQAALTKPLGRGGDELGHDELLARVEEARRAALARPSAAVAPPAAAAAAVGDSGPAAPAALAALAPVMRGALLCLDSEANEWSYAGTWALDAASLERGEGRPFFYRRCFSGGAGAVGELGPASGTYAGEFELSESTDKSFRAERPVQENGLRLLVFPAAAGSAARIVQAFGENEYARYSMVGTLDGEGVLTCVRTYAAEATGGGRAEQQRYEEGMRGVLRHLVGPRNVPPTPASASAATVDPRLHSDATRASREVATVQRAALASEALMLAVPCLQATECVDRRSDFAAVAARMLGGGDGAAAAAAEGKDEEDEGAAFCWSLDLVPSVFGNMAYEGILPMGDDAATLAYTLQGKLGVERCVLDFRSVRVGKRATKHAAQFTVTVNGDLGAVLAGCAAQHGSYKREGSLEEDEEGGGCWLHPPLRRLLAELQPPPPGEAPSSAAPVARRCRVCSIELRDRASGELVAGEVGYAVGAVFTSLTAFRVPGSSSCGTLQIVAAAALLRRLGFAFWDLDSPLPYMEALGAEAMGRGAFLDRLRAHRNDAGPALPPPEPIEAAELVAELRAWQQQQQQQAQVEGAGDETGLSFECGGSFAASGVVGGVGGEETRACGGGCGAALPRAAFSKSQWKRAGSTKKKKSGRCARCSAAGEPST